MTEAFVGKRFEGKVVEMGRHMGRKNVRTDEPTERLDTKILEVLVELKEFEGLVPGMRVSSFVDYAVREKVALTPSSRRPDSF